MDALVKGSIGAIAKDTGKSLAQTFISADVDDENDGRNEKSPWLIDPGMDVDERAIWSEVLETGWQNCTDEQRQAMTLLLSGWRLIDIGAEMGREMGAGKQLLFRARENFGAALGAD